jgi:hypothetical protein
MTIPAPIRALRRSLAGAKDPALRDRLSVIIANLERLYGVGKPTEQDRGDLRRRRFVRERHHVWPKST